MPRKCKVTICREGLYYGFMLCLVLFGAISREINLLVALGGLLVGPLVCNLLLVYWGLRRIEVRRKLPEAICAGDPLVVDVEAENSSRRRGSWAIRVDDVVERQTLSAGNHKTQVSVLFPHVAAGQR